MKWAIANVSQLWELALQHLMLAAVPIFVGLVLAVPIGMLLHNTTRARRFAMVLSSIIFTIPSLALFVVIPAAIGTTILNPINVIVALSLYSVALLVRTVLESLDSVPEDVRTAAESMGTSTFKRSVFIDLPLSIPVLTAGTRVVAVTNVSLVTVGAVIGVGGLGQLFTAGYQRNYPDQIVAGIIAVLIMAFIFDRVLAWVGNALTPWTHAALVSPRTVNKNEFSQGSIMQTVVEEGGATNAR